MCISRILVPLIVSILLFSSIAGNVTGLQETKIINDPEDDVVYYNPLTQNESTTANKPNIDITQVRYNRDGKTVTLRLKVKGVIEDRGDLSSFLNEGYNENDIKLDLVMYSVIIKTSNDTYNLVYINKTCNLSSSKHEENISTFIVNGDTLQITFELNSEEETYDSIQAASADWKLSMLGGYMYMDEANDQPLTVELSNDLYEGEVGDDISFFVYPSGGAYPYTYSWDFGDGSTSNEQNPKHRYTSKGEYNVTVTVTDSVGASATASAKVKITEPNGNSDGKEEKTNTGNLLLFVLVILIIIIVGVVAVIYIIRR